MRPVIDLRPFPDGRPRLSKDVAFTRRFYDKYIDLKDAYLSVPVHKSSLTVPSLHLERNMLPVQSSSILPLFGLQNFYESFKTCCRIPEEESHLSPYIPGRLSSFGCNSGGSYEKYSAGNDSPSVPGFYNKPHEIIHY